MVLVCVDRTNLKPRPLPPGLVDALRPHTLTPEGARASGTSTDAVVIAATGRGRPCRFGGPASELGWLVARVVRAAVREGIRRCDRS